MWKVECGMRNVGRRERIFRGRSKEEGGRRNVHSIEKEIEEIRDRRRDKR